MKLLHNNGTEVSVGDKVVDFRGEEATVAGWREPHKPGSTGRVYVIEDGCTYQSEYYPSVYDLEWVK